MRDGIHAAQASSEPGYPPLTNANARSLLQVKISELDEADTLFSQLMGDMVEHRRDFIRENALNVANLDV